jgi:hypothetical protein
MAEQVQRRAERRSPGQLTARPRRVCLGHEHLTTWPDEQSSPPADAKSPLTAGGYEQVHWAPGAVCGGIGRPPRGLGIR